MNFKKGNFVDPNKGFKPGDFKQVIISKTTGGSINPSPSKTTQFFRQVKNNPQYSFLRNIGVGLSFLPIGKGISAGLNLIKNKLTVSTAKTIGTKVTGPNTNKYIQSIVDNKIQKLTNDIKPVTNRERVTGMSEEFFKNVAKNNPDAVSRTGGNFSFYSRFRQN